MAKPKIVFESPPQARTDHANVEALPLEEGVELVAISKYLEFSRKLEFYFFFNVKEVHHRVNR